MTRENRLGKLNLSHEVLADLLGLHKGAVIHGAEMKHPGDVVTLWVTSDRLSPVPEACRVPDVDLGYLREDPPVEPIYHSGCISYGQKGTLSNMTTEEMAASDED